MKVFEELNRDNWNYAEAHGGVIIAGTHRIEIETDEIITSVGYYGNETRAWRYQITIATFDATGEEDAEITRCALQFDEDYASHIVEDLYKKMCEELCIEHCWAD